jgi:hypothetical protein
LSDKLRTTFPIAVTFADGELPTATKMNGLSSQAKNGLSLVEYAIGDIWNQSGDAVFDLASDSALMIPNLARYLGASKYLNPRMPYLPNIEAYTHYFISEANQHDARLPFPPAPGSTYTWSGTFAPSIRKASKADVTAGTDWWLDENTGECYFFTAISYAGLWRLTYKPLIYGDMGTATLNVIPDPDTDPSWTFSCVKIQYVNSVNDADGYYIFLPPRGPLNTRKNLGYPQTTSSLNYQSSPASGTRLLWQSSSVAADISSNAEHYRYCLPKLLTDNWGQDATLPAGFLYLWDYSSTGTIIDGLVFKAEDTGSPRKYLVVAEGSNLTSWLATPAGLAAYPRTPIDHLTSSSHDAAYYPSNGLRLVTVGSSLSEAFSSLMGQFLDHDHGATYPSGLYTTSSIVTRPINHNNLAGLVYEGTAPVLPPSALQNDGHSQYLERHGYNGSRDKYKNMMVGDLALSSTSSYGDYDSMTADSRKVRFGDGTLGCDIGYDFTSKSLMAGLYETSNVGKFKIANKSGPNEFITFELSNISPEVNVIASSQPLYFVAATSGTPTTTAVLDDAGIGISQGTYRFAPKYIDVSYALKDGIIAGSDWSRVFDGDGITYQITGSNAGGFDYLTFFIDDVPQDAISARIYLFAQVPEVGMQFLVYPFKHQFNYMDPGDDLPLIETPFYDVMGYSDGLFHPYAIPAGAGFSNAFALGWRRGNYLGNVTQLKLVIGGANKATASVYKLKTFCIVRWIVATASPWT